MRRHASVRAAMVWAGMSLGESASYPGSSEKPVCGAIGEPVALRSFDAHLLVGRHQRARAEQLPAAENLRQVNCGACRVFLDRCVEARPERARR